MRNASSISFPSWDCRSATGLAAGTGRTAPRRIRTALFAPLCSTIPDREIITGIGRALREETGRTPLIVRLMSHDSPVHLGQWHAQHPDLNGVFTLGNALGHDVPGVDWLDVTLEDLGLEAAVLRRFLGHACEHYPHVLLLAAAELNAGQLRMALAASDLSFLLMRQSANQVYNFHLLARDLPDALSESRPSLKPVLYLDDEETARGFTELLYRSEKIDPPALYGCMTRDGAGSLQVIRNRKGFFESHLRSIAREIAGTRVGLALSSGGAKGLAHVGILQVLEENGVQVDVIGGCSMGAYIGALWAYGQTGTQLGELAYELKKPLGIWSLIDPAFPPREGFIHGKAVRRRLERTIDHVHFTDLLRPLRVVATNIDTLERAVFASGEVSAAVHASIAIPGVCAPVQLADETYVDGGISDPLPVDVLREMGIERIIAVNTIPTPAYLRCVRELERERRATATNRFSPLRWLRRHLNYFSCGNILDNLLRSVNGAQIRVAEDACRQADVVLRPLSCDGNWHEFDQPGKYIALGRRAALEGLDEIRKLARRKESHESADTAQKRMAVAA
ncbi:MAG TPA: patatin-like phospholipase family protein [Roseimicrobium sp.]|nr:patatin-like phospholipase family protein [Roseimicrobium sp.]